jgi:Putative Actinobacterial Holin-X, holin superfamily III
MPTPTTEIRTTTPVQNGGLGGAAKSVAEHASSIARLELELAGLELKAKVTAIGVGIALVIAAAVFGLFMLGWLFATATAGLETLLPNWLSLLIVTLVLGGLAALLAFLGINRIKKGTPPVPEQAIREAKLTTEAIKS